MALDFPNNPHVGDVFAGGGGSWVWDGGKWNSAIVVDSGPYLPLSGGSLGSPGNLTIGGTTTAVGTLTAEAGVYLPNQDYLFGIDTTGTGHGLITLWNDNAQYFGDPSLVTHLRGSTVLVDGGSFNTQGAPIITTAKITAGDEIISTLGNGNYGGLRLTGGNYGTMFRNDGSNFYILLTASGDPLGTWNTLRPFRIGLVDGMVAMGHGLQIQGGTDPGPASGSWFGTRRWRMMQFSGDEASAGVIDYGFINANALSIVGKGTAINNRSVIIYDNLTVQNATIQAALTVTGSIVAADLRATNGHVWLHSTTNNVDWCWYVDGDMLRAFRSSGDLFHIDNGGNTWCAGESYAVHSLATAGYLWLNGVQWSNNSGRMYTPNDIQCGGGILIGNAVWWYNSSGNMRSDNYVSVGDFYSSGNVNTAGHLILNGVHFWNNGGWLYSGSGFYSANQIRSDVGGTAIYAAGGDVIAAGVVGFGGMYWQNNGGYAWCPWSVHSGGGILADGGITSQGRLTCNGDFVLAQNYNAGNDIAANGVFRRSSLAFGGARGARIEMWGGYSDYAIFALESGGPNGGQFDFQDGSTVWYIYATGVSDVRLKKNIRDTNIDALAAILATPVRAFEWNELGHRQMPGAIDRPIGFVAQELEATMPDTVFKLGNGKEFNRLEDTKTVSTEQIVPYLFRAIQQMAGRIEALEAELGKRH